MVIPGIEDLVLKIDTGNVLICIEGTRPVPVPCKLIKNLVSELMRMSTEAEELDAMMKQVNNLITRNNES